ncbi:MAG TPA: M56 family metallopeptidase [Planctomycetaceae bacterium]|nr:M56 family metallopeptidase [Planctomycetaceae bacterium]
MMEEALCFGLACSILAGIAACWIAVVVLCIDLVGRRWLSAGQRALLWGLVLLRLVAPFAPTSAVSLQNLPEWWSRLTPAASPVHDAAIPEVALPAPQPTADVVLNVPPYPDEIPFDPFLWFLALSHWIWLAGATWILCTTLVRHRRFSRSIRKMPACTDERLLGVWSSCLQQANVRRGIPIVVADVVAQPAVLGWLRPTLLLPPMARSLTDDALRMVMLHELAHIRRWDVAANWVMLFLKAMHWWNPLYWLAAARIQALREQACDAFVLRQMPECSAQEYGALLLEFADRSASSAGWRVRIAASILGLTGTGRKWFRSLRTWGLRRRLRALRHGRIECSRWQKVFVAALVLVAAVCGLTDAMPRDPVAQSSWMSRQQHSNFQAFPEVIADGPLVERAYNVQAALDRIARDVANRAEAEQIFHWEVRDLLKTPASTAAKAEANDQHPWFQLSGNELRVGAAAGVQRELASRLSAWEAGGLTQVAIECRIFEVRGQSRLHEAVRGETHETATSPTPMPSISTITPPRAQSFIQAAQGEPRANVLHAPKITMLNGRSAVISDCVSRPITMPQLKADGTIELQTEFKDEGMRIATRVVAGDRIQVTGDFNFTEFGEIRTYPINVGGVSAAIQVPDLKTCRFQLDRELEDEDSILIGPVPAHDDEAKLYVLLTFRKIAEPAE